MTCLILFAAGLTESGATGTVVRLPTSRGHELRAALAVYFRADAERKPLERLISLGVGRVATALIAVDEATQRLDDLDEDVGRGIRRVMAFAERTLDASTLNESERTTLRGYLIVHLKLFKTFRPRAARQMMNRHHLWTTEQVPYLIAQVDETLGRRQTYRALIDLRDRMMLEDLELLRARLRDNPSQALELLALRDEFDELDQAAYVMLIRGLQKHFGAERKPDASYPHEAQEIKLRALRRIQIRLQRRDAATLRAFLVASGPTDDPVAGVFFRRLESGEFDIDLSTVTFATPDPLALRNEADHEARPRICAGRFESPSR